MRVIADTSPLNYLVWIGLAEIIPKLYGSLIIPTEVHAELLADDAPVLVRAWAKSLPEWIEVQTPHVGLRDDPRWKTLDLGERAGSAIARSLGLSITGTLGVLDEAARRGLIRLPDAIHRLKQTSFRYPKAIVDRLLEEDARRRSS